MLDLSKLTPSDSVVETETVYRITATFAFTEDQLQDPETRAFFDMIAKKAEDEMEDQAEDSADGSHY